MASKKSTAAGEKKRQTKREEIRQTLWSDITEDQIWKPKKGFAQIPRVFPQIGRIIDNISGKGSPVAATYLSLLCNHFNEGLVDGNSAQRLAFESGFSGERAVTTWLSRMNRLEEMGLIKGAELEGTKFRYVLLMCPYQSIEALYDGRNKQDTLYQSYLLRKLEVGAS